MNQFKKVGLRLIPYENPAKIGSIFKCVARHKLYDFMSDTAVGQLVINNNPLVKNTNEYFVHHKLWFYSDDEICEDDLWINLDRNDINSGMLYKIANMAPSCKKIIASDTVIKKWFSPCKDTCLETESLKGTEHEGVDICEDGCVYSKPRTIPQAPIHFVTKYINAYNKGEIITEVLVEYNTFIPNDWLDASKGSHDELKVNPENNTISIKKPKTTWNREEMEKIARDAFLLYKPDMEGYPGQIKSCQENEDNWINNHL